jgi:hypothetical protein
MAMDTDSPNLGRDTLKALENARDMSNIFAKNFQIANNLSDSTKEKMKEIVSVVKEHNDLESQISALIEKRDAFIENEVKLGRKISKIALDMLDTQIALLKKTKEQEDNLEKQKELYKELKGELAGVLGGSEDIAEIFKTGGIFALGAKAAISGFEKMGEQFSNIVGTAFHMTHQLGISAGDAAIIGGEIGKANFSMTGLLYGSEATAEAAHALADQYGNAGMATSDMIKGVTQLSALTGDAASAVDLALAYENAGIAASDVVHNIEEIAGSVGVNANKVAKEMAENQDLIVNATKEELALNARLTAELVKQGVTRESIKSSSKSLMDIENNIQQANKFRLMTGKQLDVQALTGAAVQLRTARGTENKLEAEKNLLNVIKEQMGDQENYSEMSYEQQEIVQNMLGMDHERLLAMEKANQAFDLNTELLEQGSAFMGAITAGATSAGAGFGAMTLELVKMVAQAIIFNKVMTGSSGLKNLNPLNLFKRGGGGVSDIVPGVGDTNVDGGKVGSIDKSIGSTGRGVGSAMQGIAVGFKSFASPQVALGVGVVTAGIIGLGFALKLAAPGIIAIGKAIGEVIGSIGDFIVKIATPETANGLLSLAPAFAALGLAFIPLAVGLAAMTPVIPTLVALVALGAGIALIANALNGGGGGSITETSDDRKQSDPLLEEIRGLRADIKNQPINVVLNNKIVGEINRSSRAINSYVNK